MYLVRLSSSKNLSVRHDQVGQLKHDLIPYTLILTVYPWEGYLSSDQSYNLDYFELGFQQVKLVCFDDRLRTAAHVQLGVDMR